jgi:hypothetical protein
MPYLTSDFGFKELFVDEFLRVPPSGVKWAGPAVQPYRGGGRPCRAAIRVGADRWADPLYLEAAEVDEGAIPWRGLWHFSLGGEVGGPGQPYRL